MDQTTKAEEGWSKKTLRHWGKTRNRSEGGERQDHTELCKGSSGKKQCCSAWQIPGIPPTGPT